MLNNNKEPKAFSFLQETRSVSHGAKMSKPTKRKQVWNSSGQEKVVFIIDGAPILQRGAKPEMSLKIPQTISQLMIDQQEISITIEGHINLHFPYLI